MTTTNEALVNKFTVQSVSFSKDFECRVNIKKRYENILFRSSTSQERSNISFIQGTDPSFLSNVFVNDNRAESLIENRVLDDVQTHKQYAKYLIYHQADPLITDVFYSRNQLDTPLFFYHLLDQCNSELTDWTSRTLTNIRFLDKDFNVINLSEYVYDSTTGRVYNNLANKYNELTKIYEAVYIKYELLVSGSTEIYTEILNNRTSFRVAEFSDLQNNGTIAADSKAYISERIGNNYIITLPRLTNYWWKDAEESQIHINQQSDKSTEYSWCFSISNGDFTSVQKNTLGTNKTYRYYIPEFDSQVFSPYPYYKQAMGEEGVILSERLIKVANPPTTQTSFYVSVIVLDEDDATLAAYSNDPNQIGQYYNSSILYTDNFASFDSKDGFIHLAADLPVTYDKVQVSYYFIETNYEFTRVNFNPLNNLSILNKRIVIYTIPETSDTGVLSKSLFYLEVNENGKITYCEQAASSIGADPPSTTKLLTEDFYTTGLPKHDFYYDIESTQSGIDSAFSGVFTSDLDEFSFVDKYTTSSKLVDTVMVSGFMTSSMEDNFDNNPRFLVLGELATRGTVDAANLLSYDARIQGGGIREEDYEIALFKQSEVSWYSNSPFQTVYPGMGTFYVQVPKSIHEDWDGDLDDDTIRAYIQKYMKTGGYGVVDHYGIDPVVVDLISPTSGVIYCEWPFHDSGTMYNLYYSTDKQNWSSLTSIADSGVNNRVAITGLQASTRYYLYITALRNSIEEEGPIVSIVTES